MTYHPTVEKAVEACARFGFLSRETFWNLISNTQQRMTYRHWNKLTDSGLFVPLDSTLEGKFLKLSPLGKRFALSKHWVSVNTPILQQLAHDELLMNLALSLEEAKLIQKAIPEVYHKASTHSFNKSFSGPRKKIPDLYFAMNIQGKSIRVATEFERTRKTESRYRAMLLAYSQFKEVDLVLFVVSDLQIEKAIRAVALKTKYPITHRPLAFALSKEVQKYPTQFEIRLQNRSARFCDFVSELRSMKSEAA